MFFIFSKVLLFIILPVNWIVASILLAFFVKNAKRKVRFFRISAILLLIFTNPYILDYLGSSWNVPNEPLQQDKKYSCVIVLGGFALEGEKGKGYFNGASDRFIQGLKIMSTHKASHILISGGNGDLINDGFREGDWVKKQLELFNVPDSCIIIENRSRNTYENAAFSKIILQKSTLPPPYILVTSAYHMRRSLGIFRKLNIDVTPYSCNYLTGGKTFSIWKFVPTAEVLSAWNTYMKEFIGTFVYQFK